MQHRALREGITFANLIGETSDVSNWETQADDLLCFLQVRSTAYVHWSLINLIAP